MLIRNSNARLYVLFLFVLGHVCAFANEKGSTPVGLKCEYMVNPISMGKMHPQLSWQISTETSNWLQSAYQIIVSSSSNLLNEQNCDIWDSKKVESGESVSVLYNGPSLESRKRYYWKVRVWDNAGMVSEWSDVAYWETANLNQNEWTAKWISPAHSNQEDLDNIKWIWLPNQDAKKVPRNTVASFKLKFNIKDLPKVASMQTVARGDYELFVNGHFVDRKETEWQCFERQDIIGYLKPGENTVEVVVAVQRTASFKQSDGKPLSGRYGTFAGLLTIEGQEGKIQKYPTSCGKWMAKSQNENEWNTVKVVGELNEPAFGLDPGPLSEPVSLLRNQFKLKKAIKSARLYITSLGSYRVYFNGNRVGEDVLTPEFTNYNKRITYQTYDVTTLLKKGKNVVGAMLGDGWYGSPLGWNGEHDVFENGPNQLLAEICIQYKDGSVEKIVTDDKWKSSRSQILKSEIYSGEFYDARLEQEGWNTVKFDDANWDSVKLTRAGYGRLFPQVTEPVKITQCVNPIEIRKIGEQKWLLDMGQNLVGWLKIKVSGNAGQVVKMRYAEILKSADSIYVDNLRGATATNSYVLKGNGQEEYAPYFTFHGFRYVEISGYPGDLTQNDVVAEVISSVDTPTGVIETSSDLVNKMYSLGIWGQKSNFISVPTDCPQRDERLGYTGDGQVFWRTGTYNFNIAAFTHKWLYDIVDEQTEEGGFTNTAPAVPKSNRKSGAAGWEDAGVIVPWSSWKQYGDKGIIIENWQAMVRYLKYVESNSKDYIRPGSFLGDWLAPDMTTPNNLISTCYFAMTTQMMSEMASAIGKEEEAQQYDRLYSNIRKAFQEKFITQEGVVGSGSQTSYVLALKAQMIPDTLKEKVVNNLVSAIKERDWHVSTGFLGTPYLLFVLSENGRSDIAYKLLLNETFPSWGYMIKNGATTWWEHWDSDTGDPKMNSFNHYAFGSVVEWIYREMLGINVDTNSSGFKEIFISPEFDLSGNISHAKGSYNSVYGEIVSEWQMNSDNTVTLKVNIPANTTATIIKPQMAKNFVKDNKVVDAEKIEVGSGMHEFVISL